MTRYDRLKSWMLERIRGCEPDDALPSERALIRQFGYSRFTINRVMQDLDQAGFVERRVGIGTFVASPDKLVRIEAERKRDGRAELVVAYPDVASSINSLIVHLFEKLAARHAFRILPFKLQLMESYDQFVRFVGECERLAGIMLRPWGDTISEPTLDALDAFGVPVAITTDLAASPGRSRRKLHTVGVDYFHSGYSMISYLHAKGCRTFAYIASQKGCDHARDLRMRGMRRAVKDLGLKPRSLFQAPPPRNRRVEHTIQLGYDMTRAAVDERGRSDGYAYSSDEGALGGQKALQDMGIADAVAIGEGDEYYARFLSPPIATVSYTKRDISEFAIDAIVRGASRRRHLLPVRVVDRPIDSSVEPRVVEIERPGR